MEERLKAELKGLAWELVGEAHGQITYESVGDEAFNFDIEERDLVMQFRWTLKKCLFELWDVLENGESRYEQYENGQYENCDSIRARLNDLNQRYKRRLRRARLENFYSKGFYQDGT